MRWNPARRLRLELSRYLKGRVVLAFVVVGLAAGAVLVNLLLLYSNRGSRMLPEQNPTHPSLGLHELSGMLDGDCSVSVNRTHRISLEFMIEGDTIIPVDGGTQDEFYG